MALRPDVVSEPDACISPHPSAPILLPALLADPTGDDKLPAACGAPRNAGAEESLSLYLQRIGDSIRSSFSLSFSDDCGILSCHCCGLALGYRA